MQSDSSTSRFGQFLILGLAVLAYAVAILVFGRRAGISEFVGELFSWPSVTKWFIAYSVLYFTGAVLLALCIRSRTPKASISVRRSLATCGFVSLILGGFAVYAVLDNLAFKLLA